MPKFRRRPVGVVAEQYLPGYYVPAGVCHKWGCLTAPPSYAYLPHVHIGIGARTVKPGDWVVTEGKSKSVCNQGDFARQYEPLEEGT